MNKYGYGCPCGCPCDEEVWEEGCYDPKICEECLTYKGESVIPPTLEKEISGNRILCKSIIKKEECP